MACGSRPSFCDGCREPAFDQAQSDGEVGIIRRQRHDDMQVIGENYHRVNGEVVLPPRLPHRRAQGGDVICECG
jgi:hypothetical protein